MNQPAKQTYQNDLIFQGFFYFPMMIAYLFGFLESEGFVLGALLQFLVGVSQVISGAFHSVRYEDKVHKRYFAMAIGYLAFLFLGGMLMSEMYLGGAGDVFIILFLFVIPVGIATWYYRLTWLAYKKAPVVMDGEEMPRRKPFQEDILDDALL